MPSDSVLLPLCIAVALVLTVIGAVFWIKGRHGRGLRSIGLAAGVVGLYLTGLLGLVWDAVLALGRWGRALVLNPTIWAGIGLLGLMVVLWVIGGYLINRRTRAVARGEVGRGRQPAATSGRSSRPAVTPAQSTGSQRPVSQPTGSQPTPADDEDAEIEALLRKRGIS